MTPAENLALWFRVEKTDPKHVKPITGKQYSGNSPKPHYMVWRLTQEFGPCGIGWGYDITDERIERFSETDTLHIVKLDFWYELNGQTGHIQQMGQTIASYVTSQGKFKVDEDAPKKSVTDALVKCASYLGFAGDIFMGRWDDSKYVEGLRQEFSGDSLVPALEASIEQEKQKRQGVMGAVLADIDLSPEQRAALAKLAAQVQQHLPATAYEVIEEQGLNNDERLYLWSLLDSKTRSALKREKTTRSLTAGATA